MPLEPRTRNVVGGAADGAYRSPARRQRDGDREYIQVGCELPGDSYRWHSPTQRWLTEALYDSAKITDTTNHQGKP